jgi:hypothetical protein
VKGLNAYERAVKESEEQNLLGWEETMDVDITVTVKKSGPKKPYAAGSLVCASCPRIFLFTELDPENDRIHSVEFTRHTIGTIIGMKWHVAASDIRRSTIDPVFRSARPCNSKGIVLLTGQTRGELWYHVMFPNGTYWARWDWLCRLARPEGMKK